MQVLQIGCGALGSLIAQATLTRGHALTIARRSDKPVPKGAQSLRVDVVSGNGLSALGTLQPDLLLYCLAPVSSGAQAYRETYYQGLQQVLAHVQSAGLKQVFFISSTRVYGAQAGEWVDDDTSVVPADAGGQALLDAERLLDALPCGNTALRISGIYGPDRRYLVRMAQQPQSWPQQSHWTNRMHEQDVVGALMHFYDAVAEGQSLHSHYILSDNSPVLQHEVLQWIATQMGWPQPETPLSQPVTGKRLRNLRLQASGYVLQFPDYLAGYTPILNALKSQQRDIE
ncbi:NAD-dependent epimerase/dehydratase family protein [Methylophilus aquaticus]|uniref:NAD-dependent epimerase/dehydratase family protein n=1 Tax=Methylophilus aquaticus TaxID=1971610 RepID=A0ABT9JVX4_9PROT|nr:NAD-dependent epimerase/dehydratase family protein [Methylophilus aquaticus]MDP8568737.1 NAD-dependent epimerase/dehydratase family protein [Methylophilus aquaticus]